MMGMNFATPQFPFHLLLTAYIRFSSQEIATLTKKKSQQKFRNPRSLCTGICFSSCTLRTSARVTRQHLFCHSYNLMLIVAYMSTVYVIALPAATCIALWRQRRARLATDDAAASQNNASNTETTYGLRFLFETHKTRSWHWELVETTRKVILTCGLIFIGKEEQALH